MTNHIGAPRGVTDVFEVRVAMFDVPPWAVKEVVEAARALAEQANQNESGTRFFAVMRQEDADGRFVCAAVFDDDDAENAHRRSPAARHFAAVLLEAGVCLNGARWTGVAGV